MLRYDRIETTIFIEFIEKEQVFNREQSLCLGDFLYQWTLVIMGRA